ncbi:hypothetical protein BFM99_17265 [Stutzerimonas stutzeri]|nr:hypothetical protein BFM99_17265 [Stutzerimonas stutzeri]
MINFIISYKRLKVRTELDSIGRIEIDHLHLSTHALILQQGVHHLQGVAENQAIGPLFLMGIGIELVGYVLIGVVAKQIQYGAGCPVGVERLKDVLRRMPFMDKERYGRHADLLAFSFACPVEERLGQALEACYALA